MLSLFRTESETGQIMTTDPNDRADESNPVTGADLVEDEGAGSPARGIPQQGLRLPRRKKEGMKSECENPNKSTHLR